MENINEIKSINNDNCSNINFNEFEDCIINGILNNKNDKV